MEKRISQIETKYKEVRQQFVLYLFIWNLATL